MNKPLAVLAFALLSVISNASELPEYNLNNSTLTIPEVKVGDNAVYNAKMTFDGKNNFILLGYDTKPVMHPDIPPVGKETELEQWLAQGFYKNWKCEPNVHPQTGNSPHGTVRTCSNPLLSSTNENPFPVGAASVKELYSGSTITGYAISVKVTVGDSPDTWYWYENIDGNTIANSTAFDGCEGCHVQAKTDRVFIRVQ